MIITRTKNYRLIFSCLHTEALTMAVADYRVPIFIDLIIYYKVHASKTDL